MKLLLIPALLGLLTLPVSAGTVSFDTFSIDFVDVGNAGNMADDTTYGAVSYAYQIAVHEVSEDMIAAANTAGSLGLTQDSRGTDKPSTSITWNEAARFVNWLNTSNRFQAAYDFATQPGDVAPAYDPNENLTLWSSPDAWQLGGENLFRHKDAHYFLPSEDEWYKAAYYDGNTSTYFDYATGSDTAPAQTFGGTAAGTAVYWPLGEPNSPPGPADITNAGGLSPYGTMAQNGNVWEWAESGETAPNDLARVLRGGSWFFSSDSLQSSSRLDDLPASGSDLLGFRVAAVPEPSTIWMMLVGAIGLMIRRKC